jgi:hypothetical protein
MEARFMSLDVRPYQIRTQQEWDRLANFAESFGHEIDIGFPYVVLINKAKEWIGYACMVSVPSPGSSGTPVMVTSWHPQMSPRDLVRGMQVLTHWSFMGYGKAATLIPDNSPLAPHMEQLGFQLWTPNHRLYTTK